MISIMEDSLPLRHRLKKEEHKNEVTAERKIKQQIDIFGFLPSTSNTRYRGWAGLISVVHKKRQRRKSLKKYQAGIIQQLFAEGEVNIVE